MDIILAGISYALTPLNLLFIALGVSLGIIVGAIPGLSAPMAIAIAVPLTYAMNPVSALAFLVGVHKGGEYGGSISSILINTPGEISSALTALDGYPLAKQGKPRKALMISLYAGVTGDIFADTILILTALPLAMIALKLGDAEILGLLIFSFAFIATLLGRSLLKGIAAAALGMLAAMVGLDPETGGHRMTFGVLALDDGLSLAAVAIGLLAFAEVLVQIEEYFRRQVVDGEIKKASLAGGADNHLTFREYLSCWRALLRGSVIGTAIGAMPGLGAAVAAFLAYGAEKRASKTPEQFGTGKLEGIAAIESSNNAVIGSSLMPLLALGIPGSATAALIMGAFLIQGIAPGPFIFERNGAVVYGIFASLMIANLFNLVIGNVGLRFFTMLLAVPRPVILASVSILCLTGGYAAEGSMFGIAVMMVFALLGYLMRKLDYPYIIFLIGFILAPMFERSLRHTVILFDNPYTLAIEHPLLPIFILLGIYSAWRGTRGKRKKDSLLGNLPTAAD